MQNSKPTDIEILSSDELMRRIFPDRDQDFIPRPVRMKGRNARKARLQVIAMKRAWIDG